MVVKEASIFLAGSLLIGIAGIIVAGTLLILNNLFHKFWKPVKLVAYHQPKYEDEFSRITPVMGEDPKMDKPIEKK